MFTVKRILIEKSLCRKIPLSGMFVSLNLLFLILSCNPMERELEDTAWYTGPVRGFKWDINKDRYFELMIFGKHNKFEVGSYHSDSNTFIYREMESHDDVIYESTKWEIKQDSLFCPAGYYLIINLNEKKMTLKNIKTNTITIWKKIVL